MMMWIRRLSHSISTGITAGKLYPVDRELPNGGYIIIDDLGKEYATLGSSLLWEVVNDDVVQEDS